MTMTDARWDGFPDRASARRAAAWSLHPDAGGDANEFAAALTTIDRRFGVRRQIAPAEPIDVLIQRSRRGAAQARLRQIRRLYRRTRARLPLQRRRYSSL